MSRRKSTFADNFVRSLPVSHSVDFNGPLLERLNINDMSVGMKFKLLTPRYNVISTTAQLMAATNHAPCSFPQRSPQNGWRGRQLWCRRRGWCIPQYIRDVNYRPCHMHRTKIYNNVDIIKLSKNKTMFTILHVSWVDLYCTGEK